MPSPSDGGPRHSRVLIIGAGPSGVATASRLMDRGVLDVTILEAENRLGGRIESVRLGEGVVDLGAQWVHGVKGNVVYEMASPLGLLDEDAPGRLSDTRFVWGNGTLPQNQALLFNLTEVMWSFTYDVQGLRSFNGSFGEFHIQKYVATGSRSAYSLKKESSVLSSPKFIEVVTFWADSSSMFRDWLMLSPLPAR